MNFLSNLFQRKASVENVAKDEILSQRPTETTAKTKQQAFIRDFLKPLLKAEGYKTAGNKWWKVNEPFFNFIELQNFSWNSRNSVDFTFNFTTGFINQVENAHKPTIHDGLAYVRESYFGVTKNDCWKGLNGYHIDDTTDLMSFSEQVINDFKLLILPKFTLLTDEDSIANFYSDNFWGPRVKQSLKLGYKNLGLDD